MIVSLMVITMVSGGVLGLVYNLTKPAIDMVEANKNISAINEVLKTDKEIAEIKEVEINIQPRIQHRRQLHWSRHQDLLHQRL